MQLRKNSNKFLKYKNFKRKLSVNKTFFFKKRLPLIWKALLEDMHFVISGSSVYKIWLIDYSNMQSYVIVSEYCL